MRITIEVPNEIPLDIVCDGLIDLIDQLNEYEEIKGQLWMDPHECLNALEKMKQGDSSSCVEIKMRAIDKSIEIETIDIIELKCDAKTNPSGNKIFTDEAAEKARAILKSKLG
jgi:hypothetical protein